MNDTPRLELLILWLHLLHTIETKIYYKQVNISNTEKSDTKIFIFNYIYLLVLSDFQNLIINILTLLLHLFVISFPFIHYSCDHIHHSTNRERHNYLYIFTFERRTEEKDVKRRPQIMLSIGNYDNWLIIDKWTPIFPISLSPYLSIPPSLCRITLIPKLLSLSISCPWSYSCPPSSFSSPNSPSL